MNRTISIENVSIPDDPHQWFLWGLVIGLYGFGDTVTTIIGLGTFGVEEGGPLVLLMLYIGGIPAFLLWKVFVITFFFCSWCVLHEIRRDVIPLALAVTGGVITVWNTVTIVTAL